MSVTHHGCKLSVEGLCVVVRLVEVAISPLDEVPRLRRKAGRFSAASGRNPLYPGCHEVVEEIVKAKVGKVVKGFKECGALQVDVGGLGGQKHVDTGKDPGCSTLMIGYLCVYH